MLIQNNIPLNDKNWFRTGGPATYFCEPTTAQEFQEALLWAQKQNESIFVLGEGANILISDTGFNGLVIRPRLTEISITQSSEKETLVRAGAGVTISELIEFCLNHNLSALEEFSGIPGTVGGSVYINIHYFEFFLSNFLASAHVIDRSTGEILEVDTAWFNFGYNTSKLHDENYYLIDATFKTKKISDLEVAYIRGRRTEIIRYRTSRYPAARTCGSFFRNFYPEEVTLESNGKKMIYIAYYLDKIGVKGELAVGDAVVSWQHANMLVNRNMATSTDIVNLARTMQELVQKKYGILPQAECRFIGFNEYPLHQ